MSDLVPEHVEDQAVVLARLQQTTRDGQRLTACILAEPLPTCEAMAPVVVRVTVGNARQLGAFLSSKVHVSLAAAESATRDQVECMQRAGWTLDET